MISLFFGCFKERYPAFELQTSLTMKLVACKSLFCLCYSYCFLLGSFPFMFNFEQSDFDLSSHGFIHIYGIWGLKNLEFVYLYLCLLWEDVRYYFIEYFVYIYLSFLLWRGGKKRGGERREEPWPSFSLMFKVIFYGLTL